MPLAACDSMCGPFMHVSRAEGIIAYPFSIRELVSIVTHLENYPDEGLGQVVRNVFDFDSYDKEMKESVREKVIPPYSRRLLNCSLPIHPSSLHGEPRVGRRDGWGVPRCCPALLSLLSLFYTMSYLLSNMANPVRCSSSFLPVPHRLSNLGITPDHHRAAKAWRSGRGILGRRAAIRGVSHLADVERRAPGFFWTNKPRPPAARLLL